MAGQRRVIVTRPAQDAAHWVDELTRHGFNAEALPLIDIGPVADPSQINALQDAWQNLDRYTACMFVSGNAVQYFFKQVTAAAQLNRAQAAPDNIADKVSNTLPASLRCLAPGPATAAALLAAGVPAMQIDSPSLEAGQFDSEALWQVVGQRDWRHQRVLVLRGQTSGSSDPSAKGRDWLMQQLGVAGARVDMLSVYERRPPQLSAVQIEMTHAARRDGSVWLFSSSEALANLMQQPGLASVDWHQAQALATHPRIAQAVRSAGCSVVQESRPLLTDIVEALRSIESWT